GAPGHHHQHDAAVADHLRLAGERDPVGGGPDGLVPVLQPPPHLPHVARPSPLRAHRVAGDHGDHPLLVDLGHLRRRRPRHLLRRFRPADRSVVTRKRRALVYGLAVAGEATARALLARGYAVTVADDRPTEEALATARHLGLDLYEAPSAPKVERLVERS